MTDDTTTGMRCPDCENSHDDWERDGEHAVNDEHNVGIITRWKCGICGNIIEAGKK